MGKLKFGWCEAVKLSDMEVEKLYSVFNKLSLPIPEEGEYTQTRDNGFLIPLSHYGVTIRATLQASLTAIDYGYMLQSIGTEYFGVYNLSILPGLQSEIKIDDLIVVRDHASEDGYQFYDMTYWNLGYSPCKNELFPNGIPLIFDRDALQKPRNLNVTQRSYILNLQHNMYAPLTSSYDALQKNKIASKVFWTKCCKAKAEKILMPSWSSSKIEVDIPEIDKNYEERLKHSKAHSFSF